MDPNQSEDLFMKIAGAVSALIEDDKRLSDLMEKMRTQLKEWEEKEDGEALAFVIATLSSYEKELHGAVDDLKNQAEILKDLTRDSAKKQALIETRSIDRSTREAQVTIECKEWEDFKTLMHQGQTLLFLIDRETFQVRGLKGNRVIAYRGELPTPTSLLRAWFSNQLEIPQSNIHEGTLSSR